MRDIKSWRKDFNDLKPFFKENNNMTFTEFIDIELGCTFFYLNFKQVSIYDLWSVLSGYTFHIKNYSSLNYKQKNKIAILRFYLSKYKSQTTWHNKLENYLKEKESLRLFNFEPVNGLLKTNKVSIIPERLELYKKITTLVPKHKESDNKLYWLNKKVCFFKDKKSIYKAKFPKIYSKHAENEKDKYQLDLKRSKKNKNPSWNDLLEIARWIDEKRKNKEKPWRYERLKSLKLKILEGNKFKKIDLNKEIKIEEIFNIVGMLGVGKSLLIEVMSVWAAKNKLHSTLILENVMTILKKIEFFESLDIKAAPIIGKSNLNDHDQKYKMTRELLDHTSLGYKKASSSKKWLNSLCVLKGLTDINNEDRKFESTKESFFKNPCNKIYETKKDCKNNNNTKLCPLYYDCPANKANKALNKADIWIASSYSFIFTRVPLQINQKNILFFEAIYKRSHFLFVDESDLVQLSLDNIFIHSENLTSEKQDSFIVKLENEYINYKNRVKRHSTDFLVNKAKNEIQKLVVFSERIHPFFKESPEIIKWINMDFITTGRIINKIEREQEDNDKFTRNKFKSSPELILFSEKLLWNNISYEEHLEKKLLVPMFKRLNLEDKEKLYKKIKLYVIINNLEKALRNIKLMWNDLRDKMSIDINQLSYLSSILDRYTPLIKEASVSNLFGFRYLKERNGEPMINFYRLKGLGRSILLEYPNIFYNLEKIKGPKTIFMSGSSWLPESSYFHINKKVDAILERPEKEKKAINRSRFEYIDTKIAVSGNTGEQRKNNLKKVVNKLLSKKISIGGVSYLNSIFNKINNKNRKRILLVVGSYKEVDIVCSELEKNREKIKYSICGVKKDFDENKYSYQTIHRSEINKFYNLKSEILVAPLRAINRGHNILNEEKNSAIGAAILLVRTMLRPNDMINEISYLNQWVVENLPENKSSNNWGEYFNKNLRHKTISIWKWHIKEHQNFINLTSLDRKILFSNYANVFQLINQVIGRLKRGTSSDAIIALADIKFAPMTSKNEFDSKRTSMLIGFYVLLKKYFNSNDPYVREIVENLYGSIYYPLKNLISEELNYRG